VGLPLAMARAKAGPATAGKGPTTTPIEFGNVRLLVRDFGASWRFYHDLLGLPTGVGGPSGPYAEFVWGGEARLGLFDRTLMSKAVGRPDDRTASTAIGPFALILHAPDVDRVYAELLRRGATFLEGPTDRKDWRLRTIHLADPDGNVVEIYSELRD
jgi:lactoylglutathione lyase